MNDDIEATIAAVADEAEQTRDDEYPVGGADGRRPNREASKMLSVRIPASDYDDLERIASKCELPVSTLVRGYIQRGLAEETESVTQTVQRLMNEAAKLLRMIGQ